MKFYKHQAYDIVQFKRIVEARGAMLSCSQVYFVFSLILRIYACLEDYGETSTVTSVHVNRANTVTPHCALQLKLLEHTQNVRVQFCVIFAKSLCSNIDLYAT